MLDVEHEKTLVVNLVAFHSHAGTTLLSRGQRCCVVDTNVNRRSNKFIQPSVHRSRLVQILDEAIFRICCPEAESVKPIGGGERILRLVRSSRGRARERGEDGTDTQEER